MYSRIKQFLLGLLACCALACTFVPSLAQAQIAGAPFTCDVVFYQMRNVAPNSLLVKFPAVNSTVTPTAVYSAVIGTQVNSIGYNPTDNYIYGIRAASAAPQLYRIGQSGYQLIGTIVNTAIGGTALTTLNPTAGVFDAAGRYYFAGQGTGIQPPTIFRIDYIPPSGNIQVSHMYNLSGATPNFGDFDFNGAGGTNGVLLGAVTNSFFRITLQPGATPTTGTASVATFGLGSSVGMTGSAFYDAFVGKFYTFDNSGTTNNFWEIQDPFGVPTSVLTPAASYVGPPTFGGPYTPTDGTSCPISGSRVADLSIVKIDSVGAANSVPSGSVITYTLTVVNGGPYPANYSTVRDPVLPGITKSAVSCTAPGGPPTAVCPATLSVAALEAGVPIVNFPPQTTLVFNITAQVSGVGSRMNTATVAPGPDTTDNNLTNNTGTVSTTITASNTSVITAGSICPAGTLERLTNLVANPDFASATPLSSDATIGPLVNSYVNANSVTRQTGTLVVNAGTVNIQQNRFTGDPGRSVLGTQSWLLSNGKNGAANYRAWFQPVTGLIANRTYQFMAYVSNARNIAQASAYAPNVSLGVVTDTVGTIRALANTGAMAVEPTVDTWNLVQGTFSTTSTSVTLTISNIAALSSPDPGSGSGDAAAITQVTLRECAPASDVGVTKTNGVSVVTSTGTTTYTITLATSVTSVTATNTLIVDPPATGLIKTSVTCTAGPTSSCPSVASTTVSNLEGAGLVVPLIGQTGGTVVFTVVAQIAGLPGTTVTNVVNVSGIGYTDSNPANNQAQDSDAVVGSTNLSVSKSDSPTTVVTAGGTTSYILTVSNAGPSSVNGAILTDPAVPGLRCTAVTCTGVVGAATCPAAVNVTPANLQVGGITIPPMGVPSSVTFKVDCEITATGIP